jgi:hypothetical protein
MTDAAMESANVSNTNLHFYHTMDAVIEEDIYVDYGM